jgi:hypothetical protein
MQNASPKQSAATPSRRSRVTGLAAAAVLAVFGVAAVGQGFIGHSTVRDALALEGVTGAPHMTPAGIAANAKKAGLTGVELPTCSVAGKPIDDGTSARCFAEYMRIDALVVTGGKTYAQLPPFASKDGKGTYDVKAAVKMPDGGPMNNPMSQLWVTETALTTALNTSYMAEQISLFGIAVGGAFLLVGLAFGAVALRGVRIARPSLAIARRRQASVEIG